MTDLLAATPGASRANEDALPRVYYHGGAASAVLPFLVFVGGVVALALSGAPDERGFWPVQLLALTVGLLLARDRAAYSEVVIRGMSQPIVMIMIMAWLLASVIGVLMTNTGLVEALTWSAGRLHLTGTGFIIAAFFICAAVSTSTGTSFGTILICGPILYPAGGLVGAHLPTLAGAILGGATFGDSISPISDTSIASALSQEADIGGTVRSRLKYVIIAAVLGLVFYVISAALSGTGPVREVAGQTGHPRGLPMLVVPVVVIALLLAGRHLLEGLLLGLLVGVAVGVGLGLLQVATLLSIDPANFTARSFIIDGVNRGLGISVFTIFLMGLVAGVEASGLLARLVDLSATRMHSVRSAEAWIVGVVGGVVLLTCHSIVAILTVGEFARGTGRRFNIHRYRRANLLDLTVSTVPFLLPYFIPVILTANTTGAGVDFGLPTATPLQVGLHNFHSVGVAIVVAASVITGFGRRYAADERAAPPGAAQAGI